MSELFRVYQQQQQRWMHCSAVADCAAFHPYKFLFIANFLPFVGALSNLPVAFGAKAFPDFRATLERTKQRPKKKVKKAKKETEAKTTIRIVQIGCERECVSAHSFIHSFENNKKEEMKYEMQSPQLQSQSASQ